VIFGGVNSNRRVGNDVKILRCEDYCESGRMFWEDVHIESLERPTERYSHGFAALSDGSFIIHGGITSGQRVLNDTWLMTLSSRKSPSIGVDIYFQRITMAPSPSPDTRLRPASKASDESSDTEENCEPPRSCHTLLTEEYPDLGGEIVFSVGGRRFRPEPGKLLTQSAPIFIAWNHFTDRTYWARCELQSQILIVPIEIRLPDDSSTLGADLSRLLTLQALHVTLSIFVLEESCRT
jgi:hypothetical protein